MPIKIEHLSHVYQPGSPFQSDALQDIDFTIEDGELLALIGHTGSGKSTLAQHLNGLLTPTSGRVLVDGEDINQKGANRRALRQRVGLLFQYAEYQLFEETVYKDIAFGPKNQGLTGDELTEIINERHQDGVTMVIISHNMDDVARIATRAAVLHKGRLAMLGTPREIFSRGDELAAMGLDVPQTVQLCQALRAGGMDVPDCLTNEELCDAICRALGKEAAIHA